MVWTLSEIGVVLVVTVVGVAGFSVVIGAVRGIMDSPKRANNEH